MFGSSRTHGKTTTSAILAHILAEIKADFTAFLGGVSENFQSNFHFQGDAMTVVEADEYDRSFLQLSPDVACITAIDADHLDIYGTHEELVATFESFSKLVGTDGACIVHKSIPFNGLTYAVEDKADYYASNVQMDNGVYDFDLNYDNGKVVHVVFPKPGRHNLSNAIAAMAMAHQAGFDLEAIAAALKSFKGVERRFSYQIRTEDLVLLMIMRTTQKKLMQCIRP